MVYVAAATFVVALASMAYFGRLSSRDQVATSSEIRSLQSDVATLRSQLETLVGELDAQKQSLASTSKAFEAVSSRLPAGQGALAAKRDVDDAVAKQTKWVKDEIGKIRSQPPPAPRNAPEDAGR